MKITSAIKLILCASLVFLVVGCTSKPATFQTGVDAEVSHDGLTKVDNARFDAVWARTDIDIKGVTKVMLLGTDIQYRPAKDAGTTRMVRSTNDQSEFPLTDKGKERLKQTVSESFKKELANSDKFTLVTEPGPDVLLIRGTLIDVVSNVPPPTVGRSEVYLNYVGEATLVLELFELQSGAILARAVDRDAAGDDYRVINTDTAQGWTEVGLLAQRWAISLRKGLESLIAPEPQS